MTNQNPFIGPEPFSINDSSLFFGRSIEIEEILSLIIAHKTLLIYAQSGAGKTSIINAGIIPRAVNEGFEILPIIRLGIRFTSRDQYSSSNVFVLNSLFSLLDKKPNPGLKISDAIKKSENPQLLIFDQFEELFTSFPGHWRDRDDFIEELMVAASQNPMLRIIFVMREDFLANVDSISKFFPNRLSNRFRLQKLTWNQAKEAIIRPLSLFNRKIKKEALDKLLKQLSSIKLFSEKDDLEVVQGEFIEPVHLQIVCQRLWLKTPKEVKSIDETLISESTEISSAIRDFYDESLETIFKKTGFDILTLRNFIEENLITEVGTRGTIYKGKKDSGGTPNSIIELLEQCKIIRSEMRSGATWYELTHDRFIDSIKESNRMFLASVNDLNDIFYSTQLRLSIEDENDIPLESQKIEHILGEFERYGYVSGQVQALILLGLIMHSHREDYEQAIKFFSRVIDLSPEYHYAYYLRGSSFWYENEFLSAYQDYTKLLVMLDENNSDDIILRKTVYHNRGQISAEMGKFEESIKDLKYAIKLTEDYNLNVYYARNGLAYALGCIGKYEESFLEFDKAINEHPNNGWVYFNRAKIYEKMHENNLAINDYELALEKNQPSLNKKKKEFALERIRFLRDQEQ